MRLQRCPWGRCLDQSTQSCLFLQFDNDTNAKALFWCHIMSSGQPAGRENEEGMTEINEDRGEDHRSGHAEPGQERGLPHNSSPCESALLMEPPGNKNSCTSVAVPPLGAEPCTLCCPAVSAYICPELSRSMSAKFSGTLAKLCLVPLLG